MRRACFILFSALFFIGLSLRPCFADKRIALVVGVKDYGQYSLANTERDAQLAESALKNANFQTILKLNPTVSELRAAVEDLAQSSSKKGEEVTVVFYFAGHGVQFNGENYLIPAKSELALGGHSAANYQDMSIKAQWVLDRLSETAAARVLLVLDACRTNPFHPNSRSPQDGGLAAMTSNSATDAMIIFAAEPRREAEDGEAGSNSPFTKAFAEAIREPGHDVAEVFNRVRERVSIETRGKQRPHLEGLFRFSFLPPAPMLASAAVSPSQSVAAPQPSVGPQEAVAAPSKVVVAQAQMAESQPAPVQSRSPESSPAPIESVTDLYGVVEIGGNGVKATSLQLTKEDALSIENQMDTSETGIKYKILSEKYADSKSLSKEENTDITDKRNIDKTINAVSGFMSALKNDRAVLEKNIFVVASSGVSMLSHYGEFKEKLQQTLHVALDTISPGYECELAFRWVVPKYRYQQAAVIDFGSASTNVCYLEQAPAKFRSFNLLPYGTMSFEKLVRDDMKTYNETPDKFAEAVKRLRAARAEPELDAKLRANPGLGTVKRLYLTGGIVWATSSFVRPQELKNNWTTFSPQDIKTVLNRVTTRETSWDAISYDGVPDALKAQVAENIQKVKKVFKAKDNMVSGLALLDAVNVKLKFASREKLFFANVARDAWRTQYLIDRILGKTPGRQAQGDSSSALPQR